MLRPWSLGDWCIWARRSGSLGLMVGWDRPVKRVVLFGGGGGCRGKRRTAAVPPFLSHNGELSKRRQFALLEGDRGVIGNRR